jgi:hypothetical protein
VLSPVLSPVITLGLKKVKIGFYIPPYGKLLGRIARLY